MKLTRLLSVVASVACIGLVAPASATIITATYHGTVNSGTDFAGFFGGGAGSSLVGLAFTSIFTFDTTLGNPVSNSSSCGTGCTYNQNYTIGGTNNGYSSPSLGASLIINGITSTFDGSFYGEISGFHYSDGFGRNFHEAYGGPGSYLQNYVQGQTSLPFDINATYAWNPSMGGTQYGYAQQNDSTGARLYSANLYNAGGTLDVTSDTTSVPEPATLSLLALGLLGLGAVRRRDRQAPA